SRADAMHVRHVTLELLRPGLAHNQLLSPLTPYLALCGSDGPVTVKIPFEHRQLLCRLARLRYAIHDREVAAQQREAEVRAMGGPASCSPSRRPGTFRRCPTTTTSARSGARSTHG